jgi:hypothetical protein
VSKRILTQGIWPHRLQARSRNYTHGREERTLHLLEYWSLLKHYTSHHVEQARQPQIAVVALTKQHKPSIPIPTSSSASASPQQPNPPKKAIPKNRRAVLSILPKPCSYPPAVNSRNNQPRGWRSKSMFSASSQLHASSSLFPHSQEFEGKHGSPYCKPLSSGRKLGSQKREIGALLLGDSCSFVSFPE